MLQFSALGPPSPASFLPFQKSPSTATALPKVVRPTQLTKQNKNPGHLGSKHRMFQEQPQESLNNF